MNKALFFLFLTSTKGEWKEKISRLKQPKYFIPAFLGMMYFAFLIAPRSILSSDIASQAIQTKFASISNIFPTIFAFIYSLNWVAEIPFGGLRYSQSEADILFSSPIDHHDLLNFHLLRLQPRLIFSTIIMGVFITFNLTPPSYLFFFISLFLAINLILFHNLAGVLILQYLPSSGWRWFISVSIFLSIGLVALFSHQRFGPKEFDLILRQHIYFPFSVETCKMLLSPFEMIIQSLIAENFNQFLPGFIMMISSIGSFYLISILLKVSIAEKTFQRIDRYNQFIKSKTTTKTSNKNTSTTNFTCSTFPQPGTTIRAIFWKNLLALRRHGQRKGLLMTLFLCIFIWFVAIVTHRFFGQLIAQMLLLAGISLALFGPTMLKLDFRSELQNLELLKSLPISSRDLMFGQIFITTIVLSIVELLFFSIAAFSFYLDGPMHYENTDMLFWGFIAVAIITPVITFILVVTENCLMVWLPGWFYTGGNNFSGIEGIGKGMVYVILRTIFFIVVILVPFLISILAGIILYFFIGLIAIPIAALILSFLIIIELVLYAELFSRFIDHLEPNANELTPY